MSVAIVSCYHCIIPYYYYIIIVIDDDDHDDDGGDDDGDDLHHHDTHQIILSKKQEEDDRSNLVPEMSLHSLRIRDAEAFRISHQDLAWSSLKVSREQPGYPLVI